MYSNDPSKKEIRAKSSKKRSKKGTWGSRERTSMSFLIVIAFFAVFGIIILTEVNSSLSMCPIKSFYGSLWKTVKKQLFVHPFAFATFHELSVLISHSYFVPSTHITLCLLSNNPFSCCALFRFGVVNHDIFSCSNSWHINSFGRF